MVLTWLFEKKFNLSFIENLKYTNFKLKQETQLSESIFQLENTEL